jgi:hypothetical protein
MRSSETDLPVLAVCPSMFSFHIDILAHRFEREEFSVLVRGPSLHRHDFAM